MVERRKHPRFKVGVPIEIHTAGNSAPIHCATSDLSLDGCYVESMYPFSLGTKLEVKLEAGDTLVIEARVITCDPQFGNGIHFEKILPEDLNTLGKFLDEIAAQQSSATRS
jgi:PilZ domain-containing protein